MAPRDDKADHTDFIRLHCDAAPLVPADNTNIDSFALFESILQRPSGAELAANSARLAVLANEFRDTQMAIRRQQRKEQMRKAVIVGCPVLLVIGLWYWLWS
ncbi:uncharacterized protein B0J16DRAFT_323891 [Fusarium flagelliforme]|uniref:uncharacterized protein n=1 Tax=Fusarium flagelliforme TaxID=2675880 RepID=UPI001E8DD86B|nr:uncharacterized protein B0J16DRAFT_323891 [Fusarium flagelliforme]KAH7174430.1 hypothetical protein B0J16DRAFT_323891 [Fusarium flagelliforme]